MTQSPERGPEWSPVGGSPHRPDRSSAWVVIGILAVVIVVGVGLIVAITAGSDEGPTSPFAEASPGLPTPAAPSAGGAQQAAPSPPAPAEPSALPTHGGPLADEYVAVARRFVRAVRAGECGTARRLTDDIFDAAVTDANLCGAATRHAVRDDDVRDYAITLFGRFGAAVQFDGGRTYLNMVAADEGPRVQALIAY